MAEPFPELAPRETIRWAIELTGTHEMIGTVGLLRFDLEHHWAEVGYEIARRWSGQGLAPEAVAAVVAYGFSALGLHRVEARGSAFTPSSSVEPTTRVVFALPRRLRRRSAGGVSGGVPTPPRSN